MHVHADIPNVGTEWSGYPQPLNLLRGSLTFRGHRNFFLSASRFQFVAIGPAKILKICQEIMSLLMAKIILSRVFAVAKEIIYYHKFLVYTIFLTRQ